MKKARQFKWISLAVYLLCGALVVMFTTPLFGWRALNVLTPSMKPAMPPGSLVLIHPVSFASLKPGQIITYDDPHHRGVTITHRVVRTETVNGVQAVITKGDANKVADSPVPAGRVVGRAVTIVPGLGSMLGWLHTPAALILLIIIPGLLVILYELRRLRRVISATPHVRPIRRVDGVYYRASALALVTGLVVLAAGSTFAQILDPASLTDNHFTSTISVSISPTPTPATPIPTPSPTTSPSATPCANVSITNTAAGSTNTVHCTSTFSSRSSSSTSVNVSNNISQSSRSGSITINGNTTSGSGTPGSITNSSSSSVDINIGP